MLSSILVLINIYALSVFFFHISVRYTLVCSLKIAHILKCAFIVDHFSEEEILDISLCAFIILAEANGTLNRMDEQLDWTTEIEQNGIWCVK